METAGKKETKTTHAERNFSITYFKSLYPIPIQNFFLFSAPHNTLKAPEFINNVIPLRI